MQLGTFAVLIQFKNVKKCCVFVVVPGYGQALLWMTDTAAVNIINLNIDSIQAEVAECKQTLNRKCTMHQRAVQTWMQMLSPKKMPMVKMAKTIDAN